MSLKLEYCFREFLNQVSKFCYMWMKKGLHKEHYIKPCTIPRISNSANYFLEMQQKFMRKEKIRKYDPPINMNSQRTDNWPPREPSDQSHNPHIQRPRLTPQCQQELSVPSLLLHGTPFAPPVLPLSRIPSPKIQMSLNSLFAKHSP